MRSDGLSLLRKQRNTSLSLARYGWQQTNRFPLIYCGLWLWEPGGGNYDLTLSLYFTLCLYLSAVDQPTALSHLFCWSSGSKGNFWDTLVSLTHVTGHFLTEESGFLGNKLQGTDMPCVMEGQFFCSCIALKSQQTQNDWAQCFYSILFLAVWKSFSSNNEIIL